MRLANVPRILRPGLLTPLVAGLIVLPSCNSGDEPAPSLPPPAPPAPPASIAYERVMIRGEEASANIYDPSIEYTPDKLTGWLSYTEVEFSGLPTLAHHINIARTDNAGAAWEFKTRAFVSTAAQFTDSGGAIRNGTWRYEVSSLVHVPADAAAPWKLFSHRYFWDPAPAPNGTRVFEYGWIAMRSAIDPAGPWGAEETLLGTFAFPRAPFSARINVSALDPSLADIVGISEPGALHRNGVLYLALVGATVSSGGVDRIFLLASDDFGVTWRFAGNLITSADAAALGATRYDGPSLVEVLGEVYLLATPERNGKTHDGTDVFRLANIATATLHRAGGVPNIFSSIPRQTGFASAVGGGQSDYDEGNTIGGVLFPQITEETNPQFFQIFQTRKDLRN